MNGGQPNGGYAPQRDAYADRRRKTRRLVRACRTRRLPSEQAIEPTQSVKRIEANRTPGRADRFNAPIGRTCRTTLSEDDEDDETAAITNVRADGADRPSTSATSGRRTHPRTKRGSPRTGGERRIRRRRRAGDGGRISRRAGGSACAADERIVWRLAGTGRADGGRKHPSVELLGGGHRRGQSAGGTQRGLSAAGSAAGAGRFEGAAGQRATDGRAAPRQPARRNAHRHAGQDVHEAPQTAKEEYIFPPIDLLNQSRRQQTRISAPRTRRARAALGTLESFGVQAKLLNVTHGPTITRYELAPAPG